MDLAEEFITLIRQEWLDSGPDSKSVRENAVVEAAIMLDSPADSPDDEALVEAVEQLLEEHISDETADGFIAALSSLIEERLTGEVPPAWRPEDRDPSLELVLVGRELQGTEDGDELNRHLVTNHGADDDGY